MHRFDMMQEPINQSECFDLINKTWLCLISGDCNLLAWQYMRRAVKFLVISVSLCETALWKCGNSLHIICLLILCFVSVIFSKHCLSQQYLFCSQCCRWAQSNPSGWLCLQVRLLTEVTQQCVKWIKYCN